MLALTGAAFLDVLAPGFNVDFFIAPGLGVFNVVPAPGFLTGALVSVFLTIAAAPLAPTGFLAVEFAPGPGKAFLGWAPSIFF